VKFQTKDVKIIWCKPTKIFV